MSLLKLPPVEESAKRKLGALGFKFMEAGGLISKPPHSDYAIHLNAVEVRSATSGKQLKRELLKAGETVDLIGDSLIVWEKMSSNKGLSARLSTELGSRFSSVASDRMLPGGEYIPKLRVTLLSDTEQSALLDTTLNMEVEL